MLMVILSFCCISHFVKNLLPFPNICLAALLNYTNDLSQCSIKKNLFTQFCDKSADRLKTWLMLGCLVLFRLGGSIWVGWLTKINPRPKTCLMLGWLGSCCVEWSILRWVVHLMLDGTVWVGQLNLGWVAQSGLGGSPKLTPQQYVCPYVSSSKLQATKILLKLLTHCSSLSLVIFYT